MNSLEKAKKLKEFFHDKVTDYDLQFTDYEEYRKELIAEFGSEKVPLILKKCRSVDDIQTYYSTIATHQGSYKLRKEHVLNTFSDFWDVIEFGDNNSAKNISTTKIKTDDYGTPYMYLMNLAVNKFWISYDENSLPLKKEVVGFLMDKAKEESIDLSENIANSIDTIIRPESAKKGGLRKG